jgi:hypothetical protein
MLGNVGTVEANFRGCEEAVLAEAVIVVLVWGTREYVAVGVEGFGEAGVKAKLTEGATREGEEGFMMLAERIGGA